MVFSMEKNCKTKQFFFKVHLVDKLSTRYDFIFSFSVIDLTSRKPEILTIMKWTQKESVLKILCLTLKLFSRDFHVSSTTIATFTLDLQVVLCNVSFGVWKENQNTELIREIVRFSVKQEWQRTSGTILIVQVENSSTWNDRYEEAFACELQVYVVIWNKTLTNFFNNLLVPIG